jgi:Tol biopolymer transport system component
MKANQPALILLACVCLLGAAACGGTAARATATPVASITPAVAATPTATATELPQTGTIAFAKFASEAQTEEDIYIIRTDGTGLTLLAHDPGKYLEYPAWSPDGTKIAYQSIPGTYHTSTIWSMNADGSNKVQLTQLPQAAMHPAWSPDGQRIAFFGWTAADDWIHIFVMNADGSDLHPLTSGIFNDAYPTWAPDGTILFQRAVPPNLFGDVFAIDPDSGELLQVTQNELLRGFALSPDGERLAVYKGAAHQIVVHPRDAPGNEVLLLDAIYEFDDVHFTWSPDGKALALAESTLDAWQGASALYIVNADGSGLEQVAEAGMVFDPDWQPLP